MTSSILKNYNQCYLCSGEVASCNGPTSPTTTGSTTAGIKRVTQRSPTAFTPSEHYSPSSSESNGNSHCSTSRVRPETLLKDRESFTFPRSAKANFVYTPESEENELSCLVKTKKTMSDESSKTVSFKTPVFHSNSLDKPEIVPGSFKSSSSLAPDVQSRLSQFPRRGSDNVTGRGMKARSRSVFLKLAVPSMYSPSAHRRHLPGLDSKSSPDIRERAMTYSGGSSPAPTRKKIASPTTPILSVEDVEDDDKFEDALTDEISPLPHQLNSIKRNSFLYLSDTDDQSLPRTSRSSSVTNQFGNFEDVYVTPFAQILANLQNVRNQFIVLTDPPISEERRNKFNFSTSPYHCSGFLSEEERKLLSCTVLDELDSCLHRLETVNAAKSVGTMAQDKFRRILSRELSHLSERSKSGHFVAEWVNDLTGYSQDYEEIDRTLEMLQGVETMVHPTDSKMKPKTRSISVVDEVPRFGISSPDGINYDALEKFFNEYLDEWSFDAFRLNFLTASQPLVALGYSVFSLRGLFSEFKISKQKFVNFMGLIQSQYWSGNAYHNSIHAADVLHATNYLLKANAFDNVFTDLEIMASLIAAAIHDVDHPGRNNQFLINSNHNLAILYNDESVLENHHLAVSFKVLRDNECNFLENLEPAQLKAFRRMVIDNVLATDMTKHLKHLGDLKTKVETKKVAYEGILLLDKFQDRSEVLQCLLHCADLSNPAKPADIASSWAYRVLEENFQQGDEEKKLGIDVGPLGDRENIHIEKCQVSFIDYIIYPLWETWAELVFPDAQLVLDHLAKTREYWNSRTVNSPLPSEDDDMKTCDLVESGSSESSIDKKGSEVGLVDEKILLPTFEEKCLQLPAASIRRDSYRATHHLKEIDQSVSLTRLDPPPP